MILEYWIAVGTITTIICFIVGLALRPEPFRNGYQARQRTHIKGAGVVIIEPKDDPRIVGDGAWNATERAKYPKSARIADMQEPRGM